MAQWVGAQDRPKVAQKKQKHPTCGGPHREPQTENEKFFFDFD